MFILTLEETPEGVFSIVDDDGEQIIPIFESEDDVDRYHMLLSEDDNCVPLQIYEIEYDTIVSACEDRNQKYAIISKDDFIIPPIGLR
jgi:hypothetical protein